MGQSYQDNKAPFDIDALLHPSNAFRHPLDIVRDPMTVAEKRAVLASWASDACAIESNPALRTATTGNVISYDDITDALQSLDVERSSETLAYTFRRRQRRRRWTVTSAQAPSDSGSKGGKGFQRAFAPRPFRKQRQSGGRFHHLVDRRHNLDRRGLMNHVAGSRNTMKGAMRNVRMQSRRLLIDIDQPVLFAGDDDDRHL